MHCCSVLNHKKVQWGNIFIGTVGDIIILIYVEPGRDGLHLSRLEAFYLLSTKYIKILIFLLQNCV